MRRRAGSAPALALAVLAIAPAGCGDEPPPSQPDEVATLVSCLEDHGLRARAETGQIRVGTAPDAPRVVLLANSGAAEARALEGRAEGAEQIGRALLYTGGGTDAQLSRIEGCLDEL